MSVSKDEEFNFATDIAASVPFKLLERCDQPSVEVLTAA
jgi:hypothetical protein